MKLKSLVTGAMSLAVVFAAANALAETCYDPQNGGYYNCSSEYDDDLLGAAAVGVIAGAAVVDSDNGYYNNSYHNGNYHNNNYHNNNYHNNNYHGTNPNGYSHNRNTVRSNQHNINPGAHGGGHHGGGHRR